MIIEVNNIESLRKKEVSAAKPLQILSEITSELPDDRIEGITFFVPCLNEEKDICNTLVTIINALREISLDYEILVFDDFSKDNSVKEINLFIARNQNIDIRLIRRKKNIGLGENYTDGAFIGKYKYYMCIFGSNSEPKETIISIISHLGEADIIIPYLTHIHRPIFRRYLSYTFTFIVNLLSGNSIRYYNWCVVHNRINVMRWHSDTYGFGYQAEIITRLLILGATYIEIEETNVDKNDGKSNALTLKNILSVTHSLIQIFLRRLRYIIFKS